MKNIKYILFTLLFLFFNVICVNASCTDEELLELKNLADDINITYKHLGKVENDEGIFYNRFDITVKNIPDDFYILTLDNTIKMVPSNKTIKKMFNNGTWYFDIYSNKCDEKISVIKVYIPKFNKYSLDPLCEGVDGDKFPLCGKYYEYTDDITPTEFQERVKHYRLIYNIKQNDTDLSEENNFKVVFNNVFNFVSEYRIYFLIVLLCLFISTIVVIIVRRSKKRGVLE